MPASRTLLLLGALALLPAACGSERNPSDDDDDPSGPDAGVPDDGSTAPDGGDPPDAAVDAPIDAAIMDDCDPDPPIFPGAPEVLDGVDNDCDGLIDELSVCAGQQFTTIGAAIDAAPAGGTIFVCGGTYTERLTINAKPINIIGDGDSVTILDGGGDGGSVITVENTDGVVIEGLTIRNGSAAHGGGLRCIGSKLRLANSTLTGNRATATGGGFHASACAVEFDMVTATLNSGNEFGGGGLLENSSGTVRASSFIDNDAEEGGGLAVVEGTVVVADNMFRTNIALVRGGGLWHSSDAMVANNSFVGNVSGWTGGGIYVWMHNATYADNTVDGNRSENDGGGIYVHQGTSTWRGNQIRNNSTTDDGGGLRLFEAASFVQANIIEMNTAGDAGGGIRVSHVPSVFMDNIVRDNVAMGTGGGMDMDNDSSTVIGGVISGNEASSGGGIYHWLGPWNGAVLTNIRISDNHAWRGGGIFLDDNFKPVRMSGLIFERNDAGRGGGLHVRATDFTLTNSLFVGNDAPLGGAIYHGANSPWWDPCTQLMPCPPLNPVARIEFTVFHNNEADVGSAIWVDAPQLTVRNSILADNVGPSTVALRQPTPSPATSTTPEMPRPYPTVSWSYNDTTPAAFDGMSDPTGSNGNISASPGFVDAAGGDYHLAPGSVCIDAGTPDVLEADGSRADMGMYGGTP